MGYDADMIIDTGGESPACVLDIGGATYNVGPMFREALGGDGLYELAGKTGAELIPVLENAVAEITDPANREKYAAMNPTNGWGNHGSAIRYLTKILDACRSHPKATFRLT